MASAHLRFYAALRDHFGKRGEARAFECGATVGDIARGVVPTGLLAGLRFAVNDRFVDIDHVLVDGDTVDLLPPFGGG